ADGSQRAAQTVTVNNITNAAASAVTMTSDESTVPAGIKLAPFSGIPVSRLGSLTPDVQSAPAGSIPAGSIPAGSIPAGSIPAGSIPAGSIPAGSIPAGSIGLGGSPAGSLPAGSTPTRGVARPRTLPRPAPPVGTVARHL